MNELHPLRAHCQRVLHLATRMSMATQPSLATQPSQYEIFYRADHAPMCVFTFGSSQLADSMSVLLAIEHAVNYDSWDVGVVDETHGFMSASLSRPRTRDVLMVIDAPLPQDVPDLSLTEDSVSVSVLANTELATIVMTSLEARDICTVASVCKQWHWVTTQHRPTPTRAAHVGRIIRQQHVEPCPYVILLSASQPVPADSTPPRDPIRLHISPRTSVPTRPHTAAGRSTRRRPLREYTTMPVVSVITLRCTDAATHN